VQLLRIRHLGEDAGASRDHPHRPVGRLAVSVATQHGGVSREGYWDAVRGYETSPSHFGQRRARYHDDEQL
jgi:hypothetical protein